MVTNTTAATTTLTEPTTTMPTSPAGQSTTIQVSSPTEPTTTVPLSQCQDEDFELSVTTDQSTYDPGANISATLTLTNIGPPCTSQGQDSGCLADVTVTDGSGQRIDWLMPGAGAAPVCRLTAKGQTIAAGWQLKQEPWVWNHTQYVWPSAGDPPPPPSPTQVPAGPYVIGCAWDGPVQAAKITVN